MSSLDSVRRRPALPAAGQVWKWLRDDDGPAAKAVRWALLIVGFWAFTWVAFDLSTKNYIDGLALGSLYGLIGVALVLIYRSVRIINFAAAAIGAVPAVTALLLNIQGYLGYLEALPIAFLGGPLFGVLADVLVMRRFAKAPRLILTVVTVGIAQSLGALAFFIPIWLGAKAGQIATVPTPWRDFAFHNGQGQPVLSGDQIFAFAVVVGLTAGLASFLRWTRMGIALRASAENADRASLLGIPVKLVGTVAWAIAGLLAGAAIYVQSPLIGVPQDATLGFDTLLYGMAAAVVGRLERIGVTLMAGLGIGVLIFASIASTGTNNVASALMLVVIIVALLVQRGVASRAYDMGVATWQNVKRFRPVPVELRNLPEVRRAGYAITVTMVGFMVLLPFVVSSPYLPSLAVLPLYGIVAVSLVILSGWAGQISLGQFGLVGMAAAVSGGLVAEHNIDFFLAMGIGILAGAVTAMVIGIPALRISGLYLAVTTLAFGYAVQGYILNKNYPIGRLLLPSGFAASVERPLLWGRINLEDDLNFYFVCLAFLAVVYVAALSFRRNRGMRVLMAVRDNVRTGAAYTVNPIRTKLAAFAISGGIAGVAGVLFAYGQHNVIPGSYSVFNSISIFLAVVIGGLTSLPFAVVGAMLFEASALFGHQLDPYIGQSVATILPLLLTGPLLVANLMLYPGGSAEEGFKQRDRFLRWVAARRGLHVPSLVADRRVDAEPDDETEVLESAEERFRGLSAQPEPAEPTVGARS